MEATKIDNLRLLLETAMGHLDIFMGRGSRANPAPPMFGIADSQKIGMYMEDLRLSRKFATMRINPYFDRSYLKITDSAVNDGLMASVVGDLEPFFDGDERRSTAWALAKGMHGGFFVDDVIQTLLEVALLSGATVAASQFYKELEDNVFHYQEYALLTGVKIDQEIEICNDVRLVPLSTNSNSLPSFLPERLSDFTHSFFMGKTVLVRDCFHSPKWVVPAQMPSDDSWVEWFSTSEPSMDGVKFDVDEFCEALTLVLDHPIRSVAWWHHSNPDEIFGFHSKASKSGMGHFLDIFVSGGASQFVDHGHVLQALELCRARQNLSKKDSDRLRVPIKRLVKESIHHDLVDVIIDLGIALESIYLEDSTRDEITFRLSLNAALFLETEPAKRRELMDRVKRFYSCRSKAVHQGVLKESNGVNSPRKLRDEVHQICRRSILKILKEGAFPNGLKLAIGETGC